MLNEIRKPEHIHRHINVYMNIGPTSDDMKMLPHAQN